MEDEPVAVQGYKEDGERGEEDTAGLDCSDQLAEDLHVRSPRPVLCQDVIDCEWNGKGAQKDV